MIDLFCMKTRPSTDTFGKQLTSIRKQRGLTQEQLAKMIGTQRRVIAYYEAETRYPPAHLIKPLARALKVSADQLLNIKSFKEEISAKEMSLWRKFKKVHTLSERQQKTVYSLIHALLSKHNHK